MFVEYVDTKVYTNIMTLMCLILCVILLFALYESCWIKTDKKHYHKCHTENGKYVFEERIMGRKRKRHRLIATALTIFCMFLYLLIQKKRYTIREDFAWTFEERNEAYGLHFVVQERKKPEEMQWYEEVLHLDWFDKEAEDVGRDTLDAYEKKVNGIFSAMPKKEDSISEIAGGNSTFAEKQQNFKDLVNRDHKELNSEKLWKGYEDGVEVCKVYETSENVFQTGVLAESACENAYKSRRDGESILIYTAGMVDQFEQFLEFQCRDAGGGMVISEVEICFRIEKGLYRVSREKLNYDNYILEHCALYGYGCSQYAVERIGIANNYYLMYLDNSGLNCLNILQYIDDGELCAELCQKELDRWKDLEGRDMSVYKTEGKTLEMIMETKKTLEEYKKFYK